jgi:hypothetical protein
MMHGISSPMTDTGEILEIWTDYDEDIDNSVLPRKLPLSAGKPTERHSFIFRIRPSR